MHGLGQSASRRRPGGPCLPDAAFCAPAPRGSAGRRAVPLCPASPPSRTPRGQHRSQGCPGKAPAADWSHFTQKAPTSLRAGGSKKISQESGPLAAGTGKTQPRKSHLGLCSTARGANRESSSLLQEYSLLSAPRKQASTPKEKASFCWVNLQIARRIFVFSSSLLRTSSRRRFPYQPPSCSVGHGGSDALLFGELPAPALFTSPFYCILSP